MPWGFAYAPRGPVAGSWDAAALGAFTAAVRDGLPAAAGRVSATCGSTRRSRPTARSTRTARCDAALATAGWRPAAPIQPNATRIIDLRADEDALWGDLRKKWRQYVNKARTGGIVVVDAGADRLGEFYRIYRETADRAGLPDPRRVRLSRRLGRRSRPTGNARLLFAQTAGRRAAGHALPRPLRAAGRGAVRRDDRGRRRVAGELPAQVGGHPLVARGGRHELRPVGPRDRRDRPFQDRVRRSRGPLHRRLGPRPRARSDGAAYELAAARPRRLGAAARRDRATAGARRPTGGPIERPRRGRRRAGRLGRRSPSRRPAATSYQSRAWAEHRRATGWQPRFLVADDGGRALALVRSWPAVPGGSAYLPRGPVPTGAEPAALGARLVAFGDALAGDGIDVVAADPEVPDADTGFRAAIEARRLPADRGDPAVAPPDQPRRSTAGRRRDDGVRRDRQVDPPADPEGRGDGRARRPPRRRVAPGGPGDGFSDPTEAAATRSTGSTTSCSRPASGGSSRSARGRPSSPGGGRRSRPATSSISRRRGRRRAASPA